MKTILSILLLISTTAIAQDSSRLTIRLSLKQKHLAYMGAELSERNTLADQRLRDTLSARIGSGTNLDSVVNAGYPVGFILKFFQAVSDEQTGTGYLFLNELLSGTGNVLTQLNTKINNNHSDRAAALWLRGQINDLAARKKAPLDEKIQRGAAWLKTLIDP